MPWPESVVGKLREQIQAERAYWHTWQTGEALNFRGEYYKLTLMSPFFNPGPISHPDIPIYIAGVNPGLARLAGELADGFVAHPFHTEAYLRQVLLPAIEQGEYRYGTLDELPQGLKDYYERHWRQMRTIDEDLWVQYRQPVICYLATARGALGLAAVIVGLAPSLTHWLGLAQPAVGSI